MSQVDLSLGRRHIVSLSLPSRNIVPQTEVGTVNSTYIILQGFGVSSFDATSFLLYGLGSSASIVYLELPGILTLRRRPVTALEVA